MNISEFKKEFRLICTDTWGNALDAWFECAGRMNRRNMHIPTDWDYSPGAGGDGTDKDCYWYALFARCSNKQLYQLGSFLFRYCSFLRHKGINY